MYTGTYDVQDITYNIQNESATVTIDYIENTEALGALLALMYLDQDGDTVCNQSIYAAIRRGEDDFPLPMGDPAITNSYMGLAYDIEKNGLVEDKTYPAVRRGVDIGSEWILLLAYTCNLLFCIAGIESISGSVSNCKITNLNGTVSASCVNSTSSVRRYQVILLQQNVPNRVVVVNVRSGDQVNMSGVSSGRYCVFEHIVTEDYEPEVRYSTEFIAMYTARSSASRTSICK